MKQYDEKIRREEIIKIYGSSKEFNYWVSEPV